MLVQPDFAHKIDFSVYKQYGTTTFTNLRLNLSLRNLLTQPLRKEIAVQGMNLSQSTYLHGRCAQNQQAYRSSEKRHFVRSYHQRDNDYAIAMYSNDLRDTNRSSQFASTQKLGSYDIRD